MFNGDLFTVEFSISIKIWPVHHKLSLSLSVFMPVS